MNTHEAERHAYNAAFHELDLQWHWDPPTYGQLLSRSPCPRQRIASYVKDEHPHLLKAYDADFLVDAIESRKAQYIRTEMQKGHG